MNEIMDKLLDYRKLCESISIKLTSLLCLVLSWLCSNQFRTQTQSIAIPTDEEDRISALPNDVIHHILSLVEPKYAVQTSVLSTRWKHLWKSLPILNFTNCYFHPSECSRLKLVTGDHYIPKKNDLKPLGEDALFICEENQTIGVADGVGSWARQGIDAGKYARELMSNVEFSIRNNYQEGENVDPKLILNEAFLKTKLEGSSTVCIVTLKNTVSRNYLHAVNIGDSQFIVIRDWKIVYKSPTQHARFNCPYQLGNNSYYTLNSAMELDFTVVAGDIIVVGTDGLFDNAYDYEIEHLVNSGMKNHATPQHPPKILASRIAQYALKRAEDETYFSPFSRAARQAGSRHVGGKYDDIAVVVAYVRPARV